MAELPIPVMAGRQVYDNTPTTVFVLAHNAKRELLVIRRAKQPGYGLLGLPGGYQMRGETWQEAGARELREETGCCLQPSFLEFVSIRTDEYQNNLIIARSQRSVCVESERDNEALAVFFSTDIGSRNDWAHGDLYQAAVTFLSERSECS
jgi:ADP-ribose pyrophosphatase YjhB (NUDIX family)